MKLSIRKLACFLKAVSFALACGLCVSAFAQDGAAPPLPGSPIAPPADYGQEYFDPTVAGGYGCGCGACNSGYCAAGCGGNCYCPSGYARVEYLMWWSNGRNTPPLVTTSPVNTLQDDAGVLGVPGTEVLFGGDYGAGMRSGGRVTVGRSLGRTGEFSLNGRFFALGDSSAVFFDSSATGDPILAQPFYNAVLAQQDSLLVAYPNVSENGSIGVQASNDVLGADVYLRNIFYWDQCKRIDFLVGYQFTRVDDSLLIESNRTSVDNSSGIPVGTTFNVTDSFRMQNEFHGAQFGVITEWQRGRAWFELLTKIAIGNMRQRAMLSGQTVRTQPPGVMTVSDSGLLVQDSNRGDYQRDQFSFIPEIGFTVGYQVTAKLSLTVGYSFMYWNDVLLAGNQIDPRVNLNQDTLPDPALPAFAFHNNDFWVQGISFGGEFRF